MQWRSAQRQAVHADCRVRTGAGLPQRVTLADMSSEGCALHSFRLRLRRQEAVELELPGERHVAAEVRWVRTGEGVGLRFLRPLGSNQVEDVVREAQRASIMGRTPRSPIVFRDAELRRAC